MRLISNCSEGFCLKYFSNVMLSASILVLAAQHAVAADAGDVLKNIEQNTAQPKADLTSSAKTSAVKSMVELGKLQTTTIKSPLLNLEIRQYWADRAGKQITQTDIDDFKSWVWGKFRQAGYLAYVTVTPSKLGNEITLLVEVQTPKIGQVKLDLANLNLDEADIILLEKRLVAPFAEGDGVDTIKLDNRLQNASFGLPMQFYANLKQVAPGISDISVTAPNLEETPAKFLGGLAQVNSYGLKQYGRPQTFGMLNYAGLTPLSQLRLFGQVSEGINYGRLQYSSPLKALRGEFDMYASYADFESVKNTTSATKGHSYEMGVGIGHLLGFTREAAIKSNVGVSYRQTENQLKLSGLNMTDLQSYQARIALTIDNSKVDTDQFDAALVLVGGVYDNADETSQIDGSYSKLEASARYTFSLTQDRNTLFQTRLRGQLAGSDLDSFDRISLGGTNGVRAYTSVDGVGEQGGVLSFDLVHKLPYQQYIGVFYDAGLVQPFKFPAARVNNDVYSLQGAGIQYGINYKQAGFAMNLAKGLGSYEGYVQGNEESSPRNWRGNLSLTLNF